MLTLSGRAPAKVNLALKILDRRPDGFHELRTIFQTISLADRLFVSYTPRGPAAVKLTCDEPELAGVGNLAARAAEALLHSGPWKGRVSIDLRKKIPVGAGLGGGSSDAGAVLLALRRLLKPAPPGPILWEVAAQLGSDVPFFLLGGTAVGVSRGEEAYPLPDRPREWMLILAPNIRISTPEAYREFDDLRPRTLTAASNRPIINGLCASISVSGQRGERDRAEGLPSRFENDFESVVFQRYPDLEEWKNRLVGLGAGCAMLSGSGSALFGTFPSRSQAVRARTSLGEFPGRVFVVATLSRRSYRRIWNR